MVSEKNRDKALFGIIFIASVIVIIWKLDALISFVTNASLFALGVVAAYYSGKKWLELDR